MGLTELVGLGTLGLITGSIAAGAGYVCYEALCQTPPEVVLGLASGVVATIGGITTGLCVSSAIELGIYGD